MMVKELKRENAYILEIRRSETPQTRHLGRLLEHRIGTFRQIIPNQINYSLEDKEGNAGAEII